MEKREEDNKNNVVGSPSVCAKKESSTNYTSSLSTSL